MFRIAGGVLTALDDVQNRVMVDCCGGPISESCGFSAVLYVVGCRKPGSHA